MTAGTLFLAWLVVSAGLFLAIASGISALLAADRLKGWTTPSPDPERDALEALERLWEMS